MSVAERRCVLFLGGGWMRERNDKLPTGGADMRPCCCCCFCFHAAALIAAAAAAATGHYRVHPECFGHLTALLKPYAPLGLLLEGGYNLAATAACVEACVRALLGERPMPLRGTRYVRVLVGARKVADMVLGLLGSPPPLHPPPPPLSPPPARPH